MSEAARDRPPGPGPVPPDPAAGGPAGGDPAPEGTTQPLAGVRVLELASFIAGPFCAMLLADFGAEVVKAEPPGEGDPMRQWGVHLDEGRSLWWPVIGRNKKSVTLDLRVPRGQALARALAQCVDILVENFRPGTLERWGLAPEVLHALHPGLVIVRISGFGQTGPYRHRAGFGSVAEAMGGLRYLTGDPDRPPVRVGLSIGDTLAGLFAAYGAVVALREREARGRGRVVELGITDAVVAVLESVLTEYSRLGVVRERTGNILPGIAPSNLYPTADGSWVVIGANADSVFARLCRAMGRPELAQDPRYATHTARGQRQQELDELVAAWTRTLPRAALLASLEEHGVPAGPVYTAADVAHDPHYRARGTVREVQDPAFGRLLMQGPVPFFDGGGGAIRWTGPPLGAHNEEIYGGWLGLSGEELRALRDEGVI